MSRKRGEYTSEFKQEAVKLVLEQGLSAAQAARDLGVGETVLGRWLQLAREAVEKSKVGEVLTESEVSLVTYGAEGSFSHDGDCAVSALREVYALTGHLSPAWLDSAVSQRVACGAVGVPYALGPPPPRSE